MENCIKPVSGLLVIMTMEMCETAETLILQLFAKDVHMSAKS